MHSRILPKLVPTTFSDWGWGGGGGRRDKQLPSVGEGGGRDKNINPFFTPSELFHTYQSDKSNSNFWRVWCTFLFSFLTEIPVSKQ